MSDSQRINNSPLRWKIFTWVATALLLVAAIPALARFGSVTAEWLDYPYPRAGSEGLILYETLLVKRGGTIYAPITPEQFISGPYPPLYYYLAAPLLPAQLPDFSAPQVVSSIFLPGRLVSLFAALSAALLAVGLVSLEGLRSGQPLRRCVAGGALAAVLLLAMPQTLVWASRFRGDMLMIALTAAGLVCVVLGATHTAPRGSRWPSWLWLSLGAISFSLAFFTKQTALAGPAAAALYLLAIDRRLAVKWSVLMALAVAVPFVALDIATSHWFYLKMVDYHSLPIRPLTLERLLRFALWEDSWPLIPAAIAFAILGIRPGLKKGDVPAGGLPLSRPYRPLTAFFALTSFLTLPTGAVVGADHNHLLMSGLAVACGTGALWNHLLARATSQPALGRATLPAAGGLLIAGTLACIFLLATSPPSSWYDADLKRPSPVEQEQLRKIVQNVRQNPGSLFFADDPGVLALAGKETPYDDPFTMTSLAPQGRWDDSRFRERLRTGQFALLVLSCDVNRPESCRADTLTPEAMSAIREGYDVLFRDVMYTYAPRRQAH